MDRNRQSEPRCTLLATTSRLQRRAPRAGSSTGVGGRPLSRPLRRLAAVVLQQSTQSLLAADIAERNDLVIGRVLRRGRAGSLSHRFVEQLVLFPLVRPLSQIVLQITSRYAIQMLEAKEDEMVQTFPAQRADESLDIGLAVRGTDRRADDFRMPPLDCLVEGGRKLPIPIMLHVANAQPLPASSIDKRLSLRRDPGLIGMKCCRRQDDAPRFDVQEGEDKGLSNPFGGQHFLAEEIALPEAGGVTGKELIPGEPVQRLLCGQLFRGGGIGKLDIEIENTSASNRDTSSRLMLCDNWVVKPKS